MRRTLVLCAATAISVSPAIALAQPAPGSISPAHETGQQVGEDGLECASADQAPSQSGRQPGPGSPFQANSVSGSHYAGETNTNNKNTASVSQYDIACFKGPDTH